MVLRSCLIVLLACFALLGGEAVAQPALSLGGQEVRVCPADPEDQSEPDFASTDCRTAQLRSVDPQGRDLWLQLRFVADEERLSSREPLGLFVHAKASSLVRLNGYMLGVNGVPAGSAATEVPGQMDAVFFVPRDSLLPGDNVLTMRMSAMHGSMRLSYPVQDVVLAPYRSIGERVGGLLPALVTFGLFLAGVAYFGMSAWRGYDREGSAVLAATSFAAALQLAAESLRAFLPYPYPWHEIRLVVILCCAVLVALGLLAYLLLALFPAQRRARWLSIACAAVAMAVGAWLVAGYDGKTLIVLLIAAMAGTGAGLLGWYGGVRLGAWAAAASAALAAAMIVTGARFLDLYLYLALGALLLVLFVRQAQAVARERVEREEEARRAEALASALAQLESEQQPPLMLELSQGSRTHYVAAVDIRHFASAGDYVEAHWGQGESGLYSGSLTELEESLPPGFVRTHRSHIVNAAHIASLERDASGTGILVLSDGSEVPVSRRIMPHVRRSLG